MKIEDLQEARYTITDDTPLLYRALKRLLSLGKDIYLDCDVTASYSRTGTPRKLTKRRGRLLTIDEFGGLKYDNWNTSAMKSDTTIYPQMSRVDDELTLDEFDGEWTVRNL